jgi:hypothetical protein
MTQDVATKDALEAKPEETPTPVDPADFVKGGEQIAQVDVRIAYGIIDRFSEGLYSSPNKAFEELVSNSYDAGAHSVWVYVPKAIKPKDVLAVIDDGASMDLAGFGKSGSRTSVTMGLRLSTDGPLLASSGSASSPLMFSARS